jgi:hypothetical protein
VQGRGHRLPTAVAGRGGNRRRQCHDAQKKEACDV